MDDNLQTGAPGVADTGQWTPPRRSRSPWAVRIIATVVLVLLIGGGFLIWKTYNSSDEVAPPIAVTQGPIPPPTYMSTLIAQHTVSGSVGSVSRGNDPKVLSFTIRANVPDVSKIDASASVEEVGEPPLVERTFTVYVDHATKLAGATSFSKLSPDSAVMVESKFNLSVLPDSFTAVSVTITD